MPLKDPNGIPKIPKPRKKKIEKIINSAIPKRKPDKIEYYCKIYFKFDTALHKQFTVIALETAAEFTGFTYEISREVIREKDEIHIVLLGLKVKTNARPFVQPAMSDLFLDDSVGKLNLNIYKQDGAVNRAEFKLNVFNRTITKEFEFIPDKKNNRTFCRFSVDEDNFTFENSEFAGSFDHKKI